jgi:hypothetical protein
MRFSRIPIRTKLLKHKKNVQTRWLLIQVVCVTQITHHIIDKYPFLTASTAHHLVYVQVMKHALSRTSVNVTEATEVIMSRNQQNCR